MPTSSKITRKNELSGWRTKTHEIIFESDTPAGKAFDVVLLLAILLSVIVVMLESVNSVSNSYGFYLRILEWVLTIVFTIEYILRIVSVGRPFRYMTSFFGAIDLLAIVPTYISLLIPGAQYFLVIRLLRVLRVFRILKLAQYLNEAGTLARALRNSRRKIIVFLLAVSTIVVILGSLMYFLEGEENGFTSIPRSVYWAIVTLTTVGYGDISPRTPYGQALASVIMILGYGILAVPTGIVTTELSKAENKGFFVRKEISTQACSQCSAEGHDRDARHCKYCGELL